jgi:hypothetical protein
LVPNKRYSPTPPFLSINLDQLESLIVGSGTLPYKSAKLLTDELLEHFSKRNLIDRVVGMHCSETGRVEYGIPVRLSNEEIIFFAFSNCNFNYNRCSVVNVFGLTPKYVTKELRLINSIGVGRSSRDLYFCGFDFSGRPIGTLPDAVNLFIDILRIDRSHVRPGLFSFPNHALETIVLNYLNGVTEGIECVKSGKSPYMNFFKGTEEQQAATLLEPAQLDEQLAAKSKRIDKQLAANAAEFRQLEEQRVAVLLELARLDERLAANALERDQLAPSAPENYLKLSADQSV